MLNEEFLNLFLSRVAVDEKIALHLKNHVDNIDKLLVKPTVSLDSLEHFKTLIISIEIGKLLIAKLNKVRILNDSTTYDLLVGSIAKQEMVEVITENNVKLLQLYNSEANKIDIVVILKELESLVNSIANMMLYIANKSHQTLIYDMLSHMSKFLISSKIENGILLANEQSVRISINYINRFILPTLHRTNILSNDNAKALFLTLTQSARWLEVLYQKLQENKIPSATPFTISSSSNQASLETRVTPSKHLFRHSDSVISIASMWHNTPVETPRSSSTPLLSSPTEPMRSSIAREPLKPSPLRICSRYPG